MNRAKTGRQSGGDRTTAVRRDGFGPKKSRENRAVLCAEGTKAKTGCSPFQESHFLPPSLPCVLSFPAPLSSYQIVSAALPLFFVCVCVCVSIAVHPPSICVGECFHFTHGAVQRVK